MSTRTYVVFFFSFNAEIDKIIPELPSNVPF